SIPGGPEGGRERPGRRRGVRKPPAGPAAPGTSGPGAAAGRPGGPRRVSGPRPGPESLPPSALQLEALQLLGELRQVAAAVLRDEDHVLDADAADAEVVEAGLDGHHRVRLEDAVARTDARRLVDVEADAVAGAVEEADHLAVARLGLVPEAVEDLLHLLVHEAAVDAV